MEGFLDGLLAAPLLDPVVLEEVGEGASKAINDGEEVTGGAEVGDWLTEWLYVGCRLSIPDGAELRFNASTTDDGTGDDDAITKFDGTVLGNIESGADDVTCGDGDSTAGCKLSCAGLFDAGDDVDELGKCAGEG